MCIDFDGHHSGGSSFIYVNDFCYYRNCLLMSAKLIYVLSSFHMLFCAFNIHIHVKLIKFPLNLVL